MSAFSYECEHGMPCEPGGITACPQCFFECECVRYRPTREAQAATEEAFAVGPEAAIAHVRKAAGVVSCGTCPNCFAGVQAACWSAR